jgi:hypothetical protein
MLIRLNGAQARAGQRTAFLGALMSGQFDLLVKAITEVVEDSFVSHPMRHRTGDEEKRRATITMGWLQKLVKEHGYTLDKAIHTMRRALLTELDGGTFTPPLHDARTIYAIDEALAPYSEALHQASKKALS